MVDYRAYKLERIERDFSKTLNAAGRQFKGSPGEFPGVVRLQSVNTGGFYYPQSFEKKKLTIHGTAGIITGDLFTLSQQDTHVSVAYIIARDGTAYQLFDDKYYSYHLGGASSAPNSYWSARTVAIEVSNILGLVEDKSDPNILLDTYNKPYCNKADKQFYVEANYRGYKYHASFTDAQYDAVNNLTANLCEKYKLPFTKLPTDKAYDWYSKVPDTTIFIHSNVRKDKLDFSPAFDFDRLTGKAVVKSDPAPIPAPPPPPPVPPPNPPNTTIIHPGDTLWGIGQRTGIPVADIIAANPGIGATMLQIGSTIILPEKK